jgi:hypothetical protein
VRSKLASLLLAIIFFAGCARPGTSNPGPSTTPSPVAGPTATPTPQSPLVILVIPADMPKDESTLYQSTVYSLAQENGMRYQLLNNLTTADIQMESALKVVIVLPPDPGLAELIKAAPQTQFLAVNIPGLAAAANLSTIGAAGRPVDQQAFLAGYTAAMLALDYRIGIITKKDDPGGMAAEAAFINGMQFYCGLCQKATGPWYDYPVHIEIPTDVPEGQYLPYADPLRNYQVEVAYVYPDIATTDLLEYMTQLKLNLIGESMPMKDLQPFWIVSIQPKLIPAIQRIFPDLIAGKGGQTLSIPLALADINPDLLSEGKQRLVQKLLDDLQAGYVSTGVTP